MPAGRPRVLERRLVTVYKNFDGWRIPVDELKVIGHLPKKWLTPEETEAIIKVAEKHSVRDAVALRLYSYGLRRSEVVGSDTLPGIRRRDVNTLRGTIWIHGKGDPRSIVKDLEVPFPDEVMRLMSSLVLETPGPDDKVFDMDEWTIWDHLKKYAEEAGVKGNVHPHRLRAFFANDAKWRRGLDVLDVKELMRHSGKTVAQTLEYIDKPPPDVLAQRMREISQSRLDDQLT